MLVSPLNDVAALLSSSRELDPEAQARVRDQIQGVRRSLRDAPSELLACLDAAATLVNSLAHLEDHAAMEVREMVSRLIDLVVEAETVAEADAGAPEEPEVAQPTANAQTHPLSPTPTSSPMAAPSANDEEEAPATRAAAVPKPAADPRPEPEPLDLVEDEPRVEDEPEPVTEPTPEPLTLSEPEPPAPLTLSEPEPPALPEPLNLSEPEPPAHPRPEPVAASEPELPPAMPEPAAPPAPEPAPAFAPAAGGQVDYSVPKLNDMMLGEVMIQLGFVSKGEVDTALRRMAERGERFGQALIEIGAATAEDVAQGISLQRLLSQGAQRAAEDNEQKFERANVLHGILLGEILVLMGRITRDQLKQGLEHQRRTGSRIGEALVELRFITWTDLDEAICIQHSRGGSSELNDSSTVVELD